MAKLWQPQPNSVYASWIEALEVEASDKLNSWEIDFVDAMKLRIQGGQILTENMHNTLERLYTRHTN